VRQHAKRGHAPVFAAIVVGLGLLVTGSPAHARPTAPKLVCETYPTLPDCLGKLVSCTHCHDATDPPTWNAYGASLQAGRVAGATFEEWLPEALAAVEKADADGDGIANQRELEDGTFPGDASSGLSPSNGKPTGDNPRYDVGKYDVRFAYRRVTTLYCGRSPTYDELSELREADEESARERLHTQLSQCLQSDYWRKQQLPRLADKRIRPMSAVGADTKVMFGPLRLVVGDYFFDYRLWRYILTDDRDMRDLLLAQYHVNETADGKLERVEGVLQKPDRGAIAGGQPLVPERRAGMITTQWFLVINTMFSALPRTTAAHAYRSYLGADISRSEGLMPVAGEPTDIDKKGVDKPRCASCHSTLDPLSYAFANYEGIMFAASLGFGAYTPTRAATRIPGFTEDAQQPVLFGEKVESLTEWAKLASESDQFKRNMAEMFFLHALGRKPGPHDHDEFVALWQALPEDDYSANKLIHRLVDTTSFGAP